MKLSLSEKQKSGIGVSLFVLGAGVALANMFHYPLVATNSQRKNIKDNSTPRGSKEFNQGVGVIVLNGIVAGGLMIAAVKMFPKA